MGGLRWIEGGEVWGMVLVLLYIWPEELGDSL